MDNTIPELNERFLSYVTSHFANVQARYTLGARLHPETRQNSVFLSYRDGSHYMAFEGVPDAVSFVLRTRAKEGIASDLESESLRLASKYKGAQKRAYDDFFGKAGFSEKPINLAENIHGIETIAEVPFDVPKHHDWTVELHAFPTLMACFLQPANDILFKRKRIVST